jgi:hypothetical protein
MKRALRILTLIGAMLASTSVGAHSLSPGLLALTELDGGRYLVVWQPPATRSQDRALMPVLPSHCSRSASGRDAPVAVDCGDTGLTGGDIDAGALTDRGYEILVRVVYREGPAFSGVLRPGAPALSIPSRPSTWGHFAAHFLFGATHVLTGYDHLLFLAGLLLLVGLNRSLLVAITAFTVGHSITLSLAVLGVFAARREAIEVLIAASVLLLAFELTRADGPTLSRQRPWLVSGAFGLLHGIGFASGLLGAGLSPEEVPSALLPFNVGVEAGQLVFLAAIGAALVLLGRLRLGQIAWITRPAAYALGLVATFWMCQRLHALWSALP